MTKLVFIVAFAAFVSYSLAAPTDDGTGNEVTDDVVKEGEAKDHDVIEDQDKDDDVKDDDAKEGDTKEYEVKPRDIEYGKVYGGFKGGDFQGNQDIDDDYSTKPDDVIYCLHSVDGGEDGPCAGSEIN